MQLNTKITIKSVYKEDIDSNSVSFSADLKMTAIEFLTTLEMAKNSFTETIKSAHEKQEVGDTNKWLKTVTLGELYEKTRN